MMRQMMRCGLRSPNSAKLPADQIKAATNHAIKQYFDELPSAQIEGTPGQQND